MGMNVDKVLADTAKTKIADQNNDGVLSKSEEALFKYSRDAENMMDLMLDGDFKNADKLIDEKIEGGLDENFEEKRNLAAILFNNSVDTSKNNSFDLKELNAFNGDHEDYDGSGYNYNYNFGGLTHLFGEKSSKQFKIEDLLLYNQIVDIDGDRNVESSEITDFLNMIENSNYTGYYTKEEIVTVLQWALSGKDINELQLPNVNAKDILNALKNHTIDDPTAVPGWEIDSSKVVTVTVDDMNNILKNYKNANQHDDIFEQIETLLTQKGVPSELAAGLAGRIMGTEVMGEISDMKIADTKNGKVITFTQNGTTYECRFDNSGKEVMFIEDTTSGDTVNRTVTFTRGDFEVVDMYSKKVNEDFNYDNVSQSRYNLIQREEAKKLGQNIKDLNGFANVTFNFNPDDDTDTEIKSITLENGQNFNVEYKEGEVWKLTCNNPKRTITFEDNRRTDVTETTYGNGTNADVTKVLINTIIAEKNGNQWEGIANGNINQLRVNGQVWDLPIKCGNENVDVVNNPLVKVGSNYEVSIGEDKFTISADGKTVTKGRSELGQNHDAAKNEVNVSLDGTGVAIDGAKAVDYSSNEKDVISFTDSHDVTWSVEHYNDTTTSIREISNNDDTTIEFSQDQKTRIQTTQGPEGTIVDNEKTTVVTETEDKIEIVRTATTKTWDDASNRVTETLTTTEEHTAKDGSLNFEVVRTQVNDAPETFALTVDGTTFNGLPLASGVSANPVSADDLRQATITKADNSKYDVALNNDANEIYTIDKVTKKVTGYTNDSIKSNNAAQASVVDAFAGLGINVSQWGELNGNKLTFTAGGKTWTAELEFEGTNVKRIKSLSAGADDVITFAADGNSKTRTIKTNGGDCVQTITANKANGTWATASNVTEAKCDGFEITRNINPVTGKESGELRIKNTSGQVIESITLSIVGDIDGEQAILTPTDLMDAIFNKNGNNQYKITLDKGDWRYTIEKVQGTQWKINDRVSISYLQAQKEQQSSREALTAALDGTGLAINYNNGPENYNGNKVDHFTDAQGNTWRVNYDSNKPMVEVTEEGITYATSDRKDITEIVMNDGNKIVFSNGGDTRTQTSTLTNGGTSLITTTVANNKNNEWRVQTPSQKVRFANGQEKTFTDGETITIADNGTVTVKTKDGKITVYNADGTLTQETLDAQNRQTYKADFDAFKGFCSKINMDGFTNPLKNMDISKVTNIVVENNKVKSFKYEGVTYTYNLTYDKPYGYAGRVATTTISWRDENSPFGYKNHQMTKLSDGSEFYTTNDDPDANGIKLKKSYIQSVNGTVHAFSQDFNPTFTTKEGKTATIYAQNNMNDSNKYFIISNANLGFPQSMVSNKEFNTMYFEVSNIPELLTNGKFDLHTVKDVSTNANGNPPSITLTTQDNKTITWKYVNNKWEYVPEGIKAGTEGAKVQGGGNTVQGSGGSSTSYRYTVPSVDIITDEYTITDVNGKLKLTVGDTGKADLTIELPSGVTANKINWVSYTDGGLVIAKKDGSYLYYTTDGKDATTGVEALLATSGTDRVTNTSSVDGYIGKAESAFIRSLINAGKVTVNDIANGKYIIARNDSSTAKYHVFENPYYNSSTKKDDGVLHKTGSCYSLIDTYGQKSKVCSADGANSSYASWVNFGSYNSASYEKTFIKISRSGYTAVTGRYHTDPLVGSLNNDGVHTSEATTEFDLDNDGNLDTINDIGADDFLFVFDKDNNGIAGENGSEVFGNFTDLDNDGNSDNYANGFEALKTLAIREGLINFANGDFELDAADIRMLERKYGFKIKLGGFNAQAQSLADLQVNGKKFSAIHFAPSDETTMEENFDGQGNNIERQAGTYIAWSDNNDTELADLWNMNK